MGEPRVETVAPGAASGRLGRRSSAPSPAAVNPTPDCRRCGVCCFSASAEYVWVRGEDWSRLGAEAERLAHFIGHRAFMRMRDGHCTALEVRHDATGEADHCCTIYERRPQICRDLARGSPECEGERATKPEQLSTASRAE